MKKAKSTIRVYSRDSRSPEPKNENTSKVMSANKAENTKPELLLRKRLFIEKLRGYRIHQKNIPGRPDIFYSRTRVAIFVNGCYWHRCPICNLSLPKNNTDFWKDKFEKNVNRDKRKVTELENLGYKVLTVWECEIKKELDLVVERIKKVLSNG
jgi:DNA mismatch endonuclease, patch repair protein